MKGILGRKIGMSQVFSETGRSIPVTVVEVEPNVVTAVLTKEKHGYTALQLGIVDEKKQVQKKPEMGHFKKANTSPKKFVKEIRGMEGFNLGDKIKPSEVFKTGELVDVEGTSKGKGFAGAIKRHNQAIGPRSHGGGGGSQPLRQTGSLGDMVSNRVFKGMTMPGHLGHEKVTVQNLEIVAVDDKHNLVLVKGSIPGPKKSFVIIYEAIKGLPNKEETKLVNVKEAIRKNELLEEAKKVGADINTEMSLKEMEAAVEAARIAKEAADEAKKAEEEAAKLHEESEKAHDKIDTLKEEVEKLKLAGDIEHAKEVEEKLHTVESQVESLDEKMKEADKEAKKLEAEADKLEAEADKLQVHNEEDVEDEKNKKEGK